MPHSELHQKKKKKNYAVLLALVAFMAVIFVVSIIKMKIGMGG
ncbi:MAG TPA: hypothetical protein PLW48_09605 [Alphaproteobacteria bacterium]|nr:hypothetical protein [Alphaproteobacteria bacterium]HRJ67380.1 hypothetical protein [Alphaproteobacteria bacterium]